MILLLLLFLAGSKHLHKGLQTLTGLSGGLFLRKEQEQKEKDDYIERKIHQPLLQHVRNAFLIATENMEQYMRI